MIGSTSRLILTASSLANSCGSKLGRRLSGERLALMLISGGVFR